MLTKAGLPYPQKSLRIYWNLNATNVLPIINEQQIFLNHLQTELVNAALKHNPEAIDEAYYKIRKAHDNITSLYSRIAAEKMWCDFEADINEPINQTLIDSIKTLLLSLFGYGNSMLIQSPGGLHFSIKIGALSELGKNIKTDPNKILIDKISNVLSTLHFTADEVIRNKNEMVILPGTYAYNKEGVKTLCRVLNWDHFRKEDKLR
jgi:hypothetical protein